MIRKGWTLAAFIVSLAGLANSLLATIMHFSFLRGGMEGKSFCSVSSTFDCDTVLASSYSAIGGISVAGLGFIFYLIIALYTGFARWLEGGAASRIAFAIFLSLPALLITVIMAGISLQILETICLICVGFYLVNLILFYSLVRSLDLTLSQVPHHLITYLRVAFRHTPDLPYRPALVRHGVGTIIFLAIGSLFLQSLARGAVAPIRPGQIERFIKMHMSVPPRLFDTSGRPGWGVAPDKPAKITVVEFSDFQCPFCRRAAFMLKPYLGQYRKDLRFVFVHYPLSSTCNPQIKMEGHPFACEAARYAICADRQGRFWELHDRVFERQKALSPEGLKGWGKEIGLDQEALEACLADPATNDRLAADVALGAQLEVQGTPTIFVNGRRFSAWTEPRVLRALIDAELSQQRPAGLNRP